ncbi:hypothetical protein K432DRAFT_400032 [Lepidopterella palustris CBS 459.81]|uniref:Uncharacterized protein n=1 Tax=Lepidopterella palustris CBS 459.81 TaxID=1314670 RepID=A0A8E2EKU9_9PEZI|nr:hypothetical protein K432DRAFT_400032 [Lepidopterella palustris CBS 459.81]
MNFKTRHIPAISGSMLVLLTIIITLPRPTFAATIQTPECNIYGDPDVFGPGIRWSFYLQWISLVIFLFICPHEAELAREAATITTVAVYINTFRNLHHQKSLMAVEWPLLWNMTSSLNGLNWPVSKKGFRRSGGTLAAMLFTWSIYYLISPWVFFKGWTNGSQPGCSIKYFLFAPIEVYAHGFWAFMKASGVICAITIGPGTFFGAIFLLGYWISGWPDKELLTFHEEPNPISAVLGFFTLSGGAVGIAFTEMTLKVNHITFPGTSITDSGQLVALLIGVFTLIAALFSAIKSLVQGRIPGAVLRSLVPATERQERTAADWPMETLRGL